MPLAELRPVAHFATPTSVCLSLALLVLAWRMVLMALRSAWIAHRSAAIARGWTRTQNPIGGIDALFEGVVAPREGSGDAVVLVEIEQHGMEYRGDEGDWKHRWDECARRTHSEPFTLQIGRTSVHVQPSPDALSQADLTRIVRKSAATRVLVAELCPRSPVYVLGRIRGATNSVGQPYRQEAGVYLEAPHQGPMVISTEPPAVHLRERAAFQLRTAVILALFGLAITLLVGPFLIGLCEDRVTWATVTGLERKIGTDGDGDTFTNYSVSLRVDGLDHPIRNGVDGDVYGALREGLRVPVHAPPGDLEDVELGEFASLHYVAGLVALFGFLVGRAIDAHRYKLGPWFEGVRMTEAGSGRLDQ